MAFVRQKDGYFYLVANSRDSGKVRQKVLAYFGRCPTRSKFEEVRAQVQANFPEVKVDWGKVAGKLKEGRSRTALILWDYNRGA